MRETHHIGSAQEILIDPGSCPTLRSHGIRLAGVSEAGPDFCFVRKRPTMVQILACLEGQGWALVEGSWQVFQAGQVYVTPAGLPHAYHGDQQQPTGGWRLAWVCFETAQAPAINHPQLLAADGEPLHQALTQAHREIHGDGAIVALSHWSALIDHYARHCGGAPVMQTDQRLRVLWQQVLQQLARPWTTHSLAEELGISGEHLRRLCQREHQCAPLQHLSAMRLSHARQLLLRSDARLEDIAMAVGYADAFAFSHAFRRHWGHPPSSVRKRGLTDRQPERDARRR